jgi:hypothetical protein
MANANYLTCTGPEAQGAGNTDDVLDLYGVNVYSFCADGDLPNP